MDEVTKSWMNLKSVVMAIDIIKNSLKRIPPSVFRILTAYSAQLDVYMSVLTWRGGPAVALYIQRRSWKTIMDMVSAFSYRSRIKGGLESGDQKKHPSFTL
ncbi:hypothetical protein V491_03222 [Pseudogymnoascus sp. VKM F-3775]|nr:hypothetical protein V491_03222 [Pseudogymnoascus sp. VKM F-3775]